MCEMSFFALFISMTHDIPHDVLSLVHRSVCTRLRMMEHWWPCKEHRRPYLIVWLGKIVSYECMTTIHQHFFTLLCDDTGIWIVFPWVQWSWAMMISKAFQSIMLIMKVSELKASYLLLDQGAHMPTGKEKERWQRPLHAPVCIYADLWCLNISSSLSCQWSVYWMQAIDQTWPLKKQKN